MLSFKSILFAAAALASLVSAIPTPETGNGITNIVARTPQVGSVVDSDIVGNLDVVENDEDQLTNQRGTEPAERKRSGPSCGEIVKKCHDDIAVVVVKITAAVKVGDGEKVDCGVVISLLKLVIDLLKGLLYDLKLIIKAEIILGCTLKELAGLVAGLLILVIEVVWLVLSIVGEVDAILCGLIAEIGGLLCEILVVVFGLVDGLLILVANLIVPYGDHCKFVEYTQILVILGIKL